MAKNDTDILDPRAFLAKLDADKLIHQLIERPGARVMWALKLGRFPHVGQAALRDQNTVAGVITWLYVLGFVIALIAANA